MSKVGGRSWSRDEDGFYFGMGIYVEGTTCRLEEKEGIGELRRGEESEKISLDGMTYAKA